MGGIRRRLLVSFMLLVVITVATIGVAFILILNTRETPPQPTYQRLATIANSVNPVRIVLETFRSGQGMLLGEGLNAIGAQLTQIAADQDSRVLIVSLPDNIALFDSADRFVRGEQIDASLEAYRPPPDVLSGGPPDNTVSGSFVEGRQEWLFVGVNAFQFRGQSYYILFADTRPTQTMREALSAFGTEVFPLLCQAAAISLLIAVGFAWVIANSLARPLQNVAQAASEIAQGHLDRRIPVAGVREVREVGIAFNQMVDQVQGEQRSQRDFLINVSHDLKTPLTSIQGFSQAIIEGAAANPVSAAQIIYDEAARLTRMVSELTDLARLQTGQLSMQMSSLDVSALVTAVAQRLSVVAGEKHIALEVHAPSTPPIMGDGDRLVQVFTNLISNAISYTDSGGSIRISSEVSDGGVQVSVADTGIGIPPEELPRIFERFYQVDKSRSLVRGTGLGLAIAREIVQAHNGRITVTSPGVNRGSTFTVWLPLPAQTPPTATGRRR
jgi:signal transduction histidine kinase